MIRIALAILLGGLVAGVLDILYAFIVYGPLSYGVHARARAPVGGGRLDRARSVQRGRHGTRRCSALACTS